MVVCTSHRQLSLTAVRQPVTTFDTIFQCSFLPAFVPAAAVNKLVYAVVCRGCRWNETWPFRPSAYSLDYPPPTATQALDIKPHESRVKTECVDMSGEEKLVRVWKACQHCYLSEWGLFIRLRVSTGRITAPVPGSDRCPQQCCGFGDLHLIMNSKDDIFTPALHLKKLRSYLAPSLAAITGVSRWKIATISASTSSKLLGATNQVTTALPSTGHLGATSTLCSCPCQTETPSPKRYPPQGPDAWTAPPPSTVHTHTYTHNITQPNTHTTQHTGEKSISSLIIVQLD